MASRGDSFWRVMRPGRLRLRRFGDEVAVYDDCSGHTHLLDDRAGRILERLMNASAGLGELARLGPHERGEPADPDTLIACTYDVLARLERQGIVKPVRK